MANMALSQHRLQCATFGASSGSRFTDLVSSVDVIVERIDPHSCLLGLRLGRSAYVVRSSAEDVDQDDLQLLEMFLERREERWSIGLFSVVQYSYWSEMEGHPFGALEQGTSTRFSQCTNFDMGVVLAWEIQAQREQDRLTLTCEHRLVDAASHPERVRAHFPENRDGSPVQLDVPFLGFARAYESVIAQLIASAAPLP